MNTQHVETKFADMGARLKVRTLQPIWDSWRRQWNRSQNYAIDIKRDRHGEFFELIVSAPPDASLEVTVLQAKPRERHLLLLVRTSESEKRLDRFLCGHDEREWFVAAVPGGASSVDQAREALKPTEVLASQAVNHTSARQRNRRKNRAFRRQGEWFFIPAQDLIVDPKLVLHNEPIRRGSSKAHLIEHLYRYGGTRVYVCGKYPNGVTDSEYQKLNREHPACAKWGWRVMQRDPGVYARGQVRHPDHRTIDLPSWHRVVMNTETKTRTMANVAFLD